MLKKSQYALLHGDAQRVASWACAIRTDDGIAILRIVAIAHKVDVPHDDVRHHACGATQTYPRLWKTTSSANRQIVGQQWTGAEPGKKKAGDTKKPRTSPLTTDSETDLNSKTSAGRHVVKGAEDMTQMMKSHLQQSKARDEFLEKQFAAQEEEKKKKWDAEQEEKAKKWAADQEEKSRKIKLEEERLELERKKLELEEKRQEADKEEKKRNHELMMLLLKNQNNNQN